MSFWGELAEQVRTDWKRKLTTDTKDKWLLLRNCWNRYPKEQLEFVLWVARIDKAPMPLECFDTDEKRRIALAIRDIRFFNKVDKALNNDELRLFESLKKEFKQ